MKYKASRPLYCWELYTVQEKYLLFPRIRVLLVFRRKILCDAKPKPLSRKFKSKRSRLPQSTKGGGGGVIYYTKSEVLELEPNLLFLGGGGGG